MPLVLEFKRLSLASVADPGGSWQFEGGQAFLVHNSEHIANYATVRRVVLKGTNENGQNTALVTTTLFFLGADHPPHNITMEGAHDFGSGNETGSVSAASHPHSAYIGKHYTRDGTTNIVKL